MALTRESVIEALKTIQGPKGQDIVTGGEVRALDVGEKDVRFVLEIDQTLADEYSKIKDASEETLKKLGASEVSIVLTAHASQKAPPDLKPNRKSEPKGPEKIWGRSRFSSRVRKRWRRQIYCKLQSCLRSSSPRQARWSAGCRCLWAIPTKNAWSLRKAFQS